MPFLSKRLLKKRGNRTVSKIDPVTKQDSSPPPPSPSTLLSVSKEIDQLTPQNKTKPVSKQNLGPKNHRMGSAMAKTVDFCDN